LNYFREITNVPGGLAAYVGEFFTQFFVDSFVGAAIIALILITLQLTVYKVFRIFNKTKNTFLLSFIPPIAYATALLDENFLITGAIALIITLLTLLPLQKIHSTSLRYTYLLALLPILYWMTGCTSLIFGWLAWANEWKLKQINKSRLGLLGGLLIFIYALTVGFVKYGMVLQFPIAKLALAGNFYRFPAILPGILFAIFAFLILIPLITQLIPDNKNKQWLNYSLQSLCLGSVAILGYINCIDWQKEEILAYNYFLRIKKWNNIIQLADKHNPNTPLPVAALNLALAKKNYLHNYMFDYFQNGTQGLLPNFQKDYLVATMAGEIYYHLALVNTAQRFAFEAMEALPNNRKSSRSIQRLTETNLINGHYEVARKYAHILQFTLFYRKWAKQTLTYIQDTTKIQQHTEWNTLRRLRPQEDFLFSEQEKDMMLGLLYQYQHENQLAYDYLLAFALLNKDLPAFLTYYKMDATHLNQITPKSCQEALAFIWGQNGFERNSKPRELDENTAGALKDFLQMKQNPKNTKDILQKNYGKTYWYYLFYKYM
jgi:hypothetical protein